MGEQKKQTGNKGLEKTQVNKNLSREKIKVTEKVLSIKG